LDGSKRFTLAPAYDVLPMMYRPADSTILPRTFEPPAAIPGAPNEWTSALDGACLFWNNVKAEPQISEGFRLICSENYEAIKRLYSGPRMLF
jgi:hypothetical protein